MNKTETAEQVIDTIPLVMRIVTAEIWRANSPLVPAQLAALDVLSHQSCNLSELAELNAVSLPTMSGTISKMVQHGYVQRTRSQRDRRQIILEITIKGQALLDQLKERLIAKVSELLSHTSDSDLGDLAAGMDILNQIFSPDEK